jgi:hypothetical protein
VRRKLTGADELLEQLDDFGLAGNFSDRPFVVFGHERRGFFASEFFVFLVEFGVTVGFAARLLQDSYASPRRTRRNHKRRVGKPESALKLTGLDICSARGYGGAKFKSIAAIS